jgi:hypothetical protein
MDEPGSLRLKWRLRCGLSGRLLEWHPYREQSVTRAQCGMSQNLIFRLAPAAHIPIDQ